MSHFHTISLIGMPGAGKSTVGVLLAKLAGLRFVDTDLEIQVRENATLQEILEREGYRYLRHIEQLVLLNIALDNAVISTGGSVVYSKQAMRRLKSAGPIVYLDTELTVLAARVAAAPQRGIASDSAQTYAAVYAERIPLYKQYADVTIDTSAGDAEQIALKTLTQLQNSLQT